MSAGYLRSGDILIAAGLERAVDYLTRLRFDEDALAHLRRNRIVSDALIDHLRGLRFRGSLDAVAEGVAVFAGEPLLRVEGDLITCQIAETYLLNQVTYSTMVATKAARIVDAAAGRPVVDFGLRRAHGADAGLLAARSAYIGGVAATATVEAGRLGGSPPPARWRTAMCSRSPPNWMRSARSCTTIPTARRL